MKRGSQNSEPQIEQRDWGFFVDAQQLITFLWNVVIVSGWSVAWRIGLLSVAFAILSLLLLAFCYRFFLRGNRLKLNLKHDRLFAWTIMGLWTLAIPCVAVSVGALIGGWWSGSYLIKTERLGERVGKLAFKGIAASIATANLKETGYSEAELAEALMTGEQKITIAQLHTYTSHNAGELSARALEALLAIESDEKVHSSTVWFIEKTLDTMFYYQLDGQGDAIYKLANKVAEHDRLSDNDGLVTVQEISDVACQTLLDKSVVKLWTIMMLELIVPTLLTLCLIPIVPPILAWTVRKTLQWWHNRKPQEADESQDGPLDSATAP